MVYVINKNGNPLMPTSNVKARILLKQKKAKCIKRTPFTIKLLYETTNFTQSLTLGIDTGSSIIGSAVTDIKNNVVYLSEIQVRNDITDKMTQRSMYRKNRRNKKTRYRKPRFLNRKNSIRKDRFSPTIISKINSHLKEIKFVKELLPISKVIIETGTFDVHALKNPDVLINKDLYRKGINYGYSNIREYVLTRDNYTCQLCKGKNKDKKLEIHHIIFKSNGGSDEPDNLICICKTCHDNVHKGLVNIKGGKIKNELRYATQMNSIRIQLLKRLPNVEETFGYITKINRQLLGLEKEHYNDAVVISSRGNGVNFRDCKVLYKKCVSDGDYQMVKNNGKIKIPLGKIGGFRKFDKVKYLGKEYFIKGRRNTGYFELMDIKGNKIDNSTFPKGFKSTKMKDLTRINARKSWIKNY